MEPSDSPPPSTSKMTSSFTSASASDTSSDAESWIVLDQEEANKLPVADAAGAAAADTSSTASSASLMADSNLAVSEATLSPTSPAPTLSPPLLEENAPTSSTSAPPSPTPPRIYFSFERIVSNLRGVPPIMMSEDEGPSSLPSVDSDGIPIAECDPDDEEPLPPLSHQQYLWSSEMRPPLVDGEYDDGEDSVTERANEAISLIRACDTATDNGSETEDEEEEEEEVSRDGTEDDEESDIELLPPPSEMLRPNDLCTLYPTDELPNRFAEITKGRTYNHNRNQRFNLLLTGALIVVVAMAVGLGIGHFLGWSERLELQELYAEVREDRMDELTDSLVSCMTGEEAKGGDDQDLDDRVIQQLHDENRVLKEQLEQLQQSVDNSPERKVEEELTVILRDRVNDLLQANADLEREVARLRYSHSAISEAEKSKQDAASTKSHLQSARAEINEMANENDQLRMQVGKARYGSGGPAEIEVSMTDKEKDQMNTLIAENEELKNEVRKIRYGPPPKEKEKRVEENAASFAHPIQVVTPENVTVDYDDIDEGFVEVEHEEELLPLPQSKHFQYDTEDISGGESEPETITDDESASEKPWMFHRLSNVVESSSSYDDSTLFDQKKAIDMVDTVKERLTRSVPKEEASLERLKKVASEAERVLVEKWQELEAMSEGEAAQTHVEETTVAVAKLGKTLMKALKKIRESTDHERHGGFVERWSAIEGKFQHKWQLALDKYDRVVKRKEAKAEVRRMKDAYESAKAEVASERNATGEFCASPHEGGANNTGGDSWVFQRAEKRSSVRKESTRSDWIFKRAKDRKRFHRMVEAEWHTKRLFNRFGCDEDDEDEDEDGACDDIGRLGQDYVLKTGNAKFDKRRSDPSYRKWRPGKPTAKKEKFSKRNYKPEDLSDKIIDLPDDDDDDHEDYDRVIPPAPTPYYKHVTRTAIIEDDDDEDEDDDDEVLSWGSSHREGFRHLESGRHRSGRRDGKSGGHGSREEGRRRGAKKEKKERYHASGSAKKNNHKRRKGGNRFGETGAFTVLR